jgi:hypothetical protein
LLSTCGASKKGKIILRPPLAKLLHHKQPTPNILTFGENVRPQMLFSPFAAWDSDLIEPPPDVHGVAPRTHTTYPPMVTRWESLFQCFTPGTVAYETISFYHSHTHIPAGILREWG